MEELPLKLDKRDKIIISALEENSRETFKEIGRKCGLSGEAVEYRVNKWRKSGLIIRVFAEPNLEFLGLKTYRLYLKVENMPLEREKALINEYSAKSTVQWFAITHGNWDYIIRFLLKDEEEFKNAIGDVLSKYGKFIKAKDVAITLSQTYLPISYFSETARQSFLSKKEKAVKNITLDSTDWRILSELFEDSRIPTVLIAKKFGISADTVQYRIKKMIKENIIKMFTCWLDRRLLGYSSYKAFFWLYYITPEEESKFIGYCESHPNIVYINRVIGSWDIELDFDAKNPEHLHEMIKVVRDKFSNIIKDCTTAVVLEDYIPNPFKDKIY